MTIAEQWLWEIENAQPEDQHTAIEMAFKNAVEVDNDVDADVVPWLYFKDGSILRVDEEDDIYEVIGG